VNLEKIASVKISLLPDFARPYQTAHQSKHAWNRRRFCVSACLALLISTVSFAQSSNWPFSIPPPKGDGSTDDTKAIQDALTAAGQECATVELACTQQNTYVVSTVIQVPKCVKFIGACGAVPFEGSETTIGTTLKFEPLRRSPDKPSLKSLPICPRS